MIGEIFCAVLLVPILDWLAVTRMGALFTDFDYRYWPPTGLRIATLVLVTLAALLVVIFADPDNPPWWPIVVFGLAISFWGIVAVLDVSAQRATGYREPPMYGERDDADY